MITRIEITGFKTFTNFLMEFSPLTVIAGTNASGKSNLFDALQLLARIAETDLRTAFGEQRGEARELFTQYGNDKYAECMSFKLEMLVNKTVRDNWGGEAELKYTRLRYELEIKHTVTERGMEELFVSKEQLEPLRHEQDEWVLRYLPLKNRVVSQ
jgi:AAA15 family ATPase/GTPase